MAISLTATQNQRVKRALRAHAKKTSEPREELNVIPFLDIIMNVLMFALATLGVTSTSELRVAAPSCCGSSRAQESLTVTVTERGYLVASSAGVVRPGCASLGAAGEVTVLRRGARYDTEALRRCLWSLKTSGPLAGALHAQRRLQIAAAPNVAYDELVQAIDASRESRAGAMDLFPEVVFGVVR